MIKGQKIVKQWKVMEQERGCMPIPTDYYLTFNSYTSIGYSMCNSRAVKHDFQENIQGITGHNQA